MKSIHATTYRALLTWLRQSRRAKGLAMRVVAAKLGVPHSSIGKVEAGERRLDVDEFVRLCRVLEVDPHAGIEVVRANGAYPAAIRAGHGRGTAREVWRAKNTRGSNPPRR